MVGNDSKFFCNLNCEYYPCHKNIDNMNCLFCFCPLYDGKCPGTPKWVKGPDGKYFKDCSNCIFPHVRENYNVVMNTLMKKKVTEQRAV